MIRDAIRLATDVQSDRLLIRTFFNQVKSSSGVSGTCKMRTPNGVNASSTAETMAAVTGMLRLRRRRNAGVITAFNY